MNRIFCIVLSLVLMLSVISIGALAEQDEQYTKTEFLSGDVNGDGSISTKDVLLLRKYLARYDVNIVYEYSDMNGDTLVSVKDLLILRKMLASISVEVAGSFAAEDMDITEAMTDLGIPYAPFWSDGGGTEKIIARNPYDMTAFNGKVFMSCGNYNTNQGPLNIGYFTRNSTKVRYTNDLQTEQANKFYIYDDTLYTLAIDPCAWLTGEFYCLGKDKTRWTCYRPLKNNIHCYDMVKHNGQYFFCGSNAQTMYNEATDSDLEYSHGVVFRYDGDTPNNQSGLYTVVPFIDKWGEAVDYTRNGVPRVYEMMEFGGNLYAYYYNYVIEQYPDFYPERLNQNGVYKYNDELKQFEYCEGLNFSIPFENPGFTQDLEGVMKDFEWDDEYVCVNNAIFTSTDLKSWNTVTIDGYEDAIIRDVTFIADKMYYLANVQNADGSWTNSVFETDDLQSFRRILHFNTKGWIRSFEYCDGAFFFGVGTSKSDALTDMGKECGRVYRYLYYN